MLADTKDSKANRLRTEEHKSLREEGCRLERLLEDAVAEGSEVNLTALIAKGASVNVEHIDTSLLATAFMNKKAEMVSCLLNFDYLITEVDIEEMRTLTQELKAIKKSGGLDEKNSAVLNAGLAALRAFEKAMQDRHCKMPSTKISHIKAEINAAIFELSLHAATAISTNNTVNAAATTTIANPSPLLQAFQDVNSALFSLINNQDFDRFSFLLNKLTSQDPMFDINRVDKDGKTFLHHASINTDNRFLKILLENNANPNIGDKHGWTPVHWSAFTGKNFVVFIGNAIFSPINWKVQTKRSETILDLAEKGKKISNEMLEFIRLKSANTANLMRLV